MNKEEIKKYMQSLTNVQLAELFYEDAREKTSPHKKLSIAEYCFSTKSNPASISLVTLAEEAQLNSNSHRDEFVNFGFCNKYKANMTFWAKSALGPICGEVVGLTSNQITRYFHLDSALNAPRSEIQRLPF